MRDIVRSNERGTTHIGWLKSYHSFSFNDWYDPKHVHFGPLRVLNEDWVKPSSGFGMHPHRNMEIITYVLTGTLSHEDSTGSRGAIGAGEVQRMTAGTGIFHSEMNESPDEEVHLLQIWFLPDRNGYVPSHEQKQFSVEQRLNALLHVSSQTPKDGLLRLNQDVEMFVSTLEQGKTLRHLTDAHRLLYLFCIEGELTVNDAHLGTGDALKASEVASLDISASARTEFVLFDMAPLEA